LSRVLEYYVFIYTSLTFTLSSTETGGFTNYVSHRVFFIIVYYPEAAKPYNTIKDSKNTVKTTETTEMYKNVIRPRVTAYS